MWVIDKGILRGFSALHVLPNKVFDILSHAKGFIIASLVLTAISFGVMGIKGKSAFGIDFRGGALTHIEIANGKDIAVSDLEAFLKTVKMPGNKELGTTYVQRKSVGDTTILSVRSEFEAGPVIKQAVEGKYKDAVKGASYERVGSTIGGEVAKTSSWALLASLLAIFVYLMFRFEFAFAVGAIVALFHDVLMVPVLCVLFGQELSVIHVGALLTIAGYSINDTIIVFDRIRETIQRGGGGGMRELMNEAICVTLSRTLLTGSTTLFPVVVLLFTGNTAMVEFALPITIGILLGTYSSIFIASPLVLWYARRSGQSLHRQVLDSHLAEQKAQQAIAAANASKV
jgi:SecD/SecF fusion protein